MTAPILRTMPPIESVAPKIRALHSAPALEAEPPSTRPSSSSCTLNLSAARTHDAALDILGAYKLTGNFHFNLEIVLKALGAFDKVAYEIQPETLLPFRSDCRHVVFWPAGDVPTDRFSEIMRTITGRIGSDTTSPWWARLFG